MKKILLIVEGAKTEPAFFKGLLRQFGLEAELFVVGTNLYSLYAKCKAYEFACDIRDVLREIVPDEEICETLYHEKFTYTYLVFDADLHNKSPHLRKIKHDVTIADRLTDNFPKLIEMAEHFTDETDPTIGRLYINYPMMESYRYCDTCEEEGYPAPEIPIDKMAEFKKCASTKCLAGKNIDTYTRADFTNLICMNLGRLKSVAAPCFDILTDYETYLNVSTAKYIADCQAVKINNEAKLYVLNTSLFLIVDYYGNQNGFYDTVITPDTP